MEPLTSHAKIRSSWEANAAAWTKVVREGLIESRRAGTDAAILEACLQQRPRRVLDVGCGEGWLARALSAQGIEVVGIDATASLVDAARAADGASFLILDYESLIKGSDALPGPFDAIVCNYSLFGDSLAPLFTALAKRLAPSGRLLIQTVHPQVAAGDGPYKNGWREETFADFAAHFPDSMPWYFRTLESWVDELRRARLHLERCTEPVHPATGRPLSLLLCCTAAPK